MKLAEKSPSERRKLVVFALAIAGVMGFLLLPSPSALLRIFARPAPQARTFKPSPLGVPGRAYDAAAASAVPPAPVPVRAAGVPSGLPSPGALLGTWAGKAMVPRHGICTTSLELREQQDGERPFVGYASVQCMDLTAMMGISKPGNPVNANTLMEALGKRLNPVSIILSGAPEQGGAIKFEVVKSIGATSEGCAMTSALVTMFGSNQVTFEFQDGACGGGEMLLRKGALLQ